jgi:hypothetical protein
LWIGANAASHVAEMGRAVARRLAAHPPAEMGLGPATLALTVLEDGAAVEEREFWSAIHGTRDNFRSLAAGGRFCNMYYPGIVPSRMS